MIMMVMKYSGICSGNRQLSLCEYLTLCMCVCVCCSDYWLADGCVTLCVEELVTENTAAGHDGHDQPV